MKQTHQPPSKGKSVPKGKGKEKPVPGMPPEDMNPDQSKK